MMLYAGPANPTRESSQELTEVEVDAWIKNVLEVGVMTDLGPHLALLWDADPRENYLPIVLS
jgi:hypothetical protein